MKNLIIAIGLVSALTFGFNSKGFLARQSKSLIVNVAYQLAYWYIYPNVAGRTRMMSQHVDFAESLDS